MTAHQFEQKAQEGGARVGERFVIALPCEASESQREELAKAFAEALTKRKAGFLFAIHDESGNDIHNPHVHLLAFDASERSGGRGRPRSCLWMARKGAIEEAAGLWATTHNALMKFWGFDAGSKISSLSFADRGLKHVPTIHEGPGGRALVAKGRTPAKNPAWRHIDQGHTRTDPNVIIAEIKQEASKNEERAHRSGSRDARGADGIGKGGGDVRKDFGGDNQDRAAAEPPFHGNTQSPSICGEADASAVANVPPFASPRSNPPGKVEMAVAPPFVGTPAIWIRHRVRRIFWELTMLRDTLRVRLAPAQTRKPSIVSGFPDPQSREAPRFPIRSRSSETGQRDE